MSPLAVALLTLAAGLSIGIVVGYVVALEQGDSP